jgi:hypothetical protein
MCCNDTAKRSERVEREPWNVNDRRRGGIGLSHPRRQQNATSVGLFDYKVDAARMNNAPEGKNALADARMVRISDDNLEGLFVGSMSSDLPDLESPFSRRRFPLSSGDPVIPA